MSDLSASPALLCVSNYRSDIGYAWDFIAGLYAGTADRLATRGLRTFVAYPELRGTPRSLTGSAAVPIHLDASLTTTGSLRAVVRFIRRENVRAVYFTDRPAIRVGYLGLRAAGARYILVHHHSSGERTPPRGVRRLLKWTAARMPGVVADTVICVSDYVARRQREVGMIPPERVHRVWNGLPVQHNSSGGTAESAQSGSGVRERLSISPEAPLIVCACRASPEKGVADLLRAFERMARSESIRSRPVLIYAGDGPQLAQLQKLRETLTSREQIRLLGHEADVQRLLNAADLCVVPSVWQEAFGLSVLEPMALAKPVVATAVGAIPELIESDVSGLLVPPGRPDELARAMSHLLRNPTIAARMGMAARARVLRHFTAERQLNALAAFLSNGMLAS